MLAVSKNTNRRNNRIAILVILLAITLAFLLAGCTSRSERMQIQLEKESIAFDSYPWDVEFSVNDIYNETDTHFYFYQDTMYNSTTKGIMMYKVRKDCTLRALDERGSYYITKGPVVDFEGSTLMRNELENTSKGGG